VVGLSCFLAGQEKGLVVVGRSGEVAKGGGIGGTNFSKGDCSHHLVCYALLASLLKGCYIPRMKSQQATNPNNWPYGHAPTSEIA
jgi:hypothetical protein